MAEEFHLQEIEETHAAAFAEFLQKVQKTNPLIYAELFSKGALQDAKGFKAFAKVCQKERRDWRPGAKDISTTHYLVFDQHGVVRAYAQMRFPLDETMDASGGNFRLVLAAPDDAAAAIHSINRLLFEAHRAGLARVFLTCAAENPILANAIQLNRGVRAEGETSDRLSFWIHFR